MQTDTLALLADCVRRFTDLAGIIRNDTTKVLSTGDEIDVVKHFDQLRIANEQIKTARKALEEMADDLSSNSIPTLFMNRSLKTITIEGVGRCTVSYRWSASMLDKPKGMEWLTANGHGDLIQPTVNSSSLSAFAKEMSVDGNDLPSDIFKVGQQPYTSITKA